MMTSRFDDYEFIDDEVAGMFEDVESFDDEFLPGLVAGGLNAVGNLLGGLGGAATGAAQGLRPTRPNVQRYPGALPSVGPRFPAPSMPGMVATQNQVQALAKTVADNSTQLKALNNRVGVVNERINTTERKLSGEVNQLKASNTVQDQQIRRLRIANKTLRDDLEKYQQTSIMLTVLTSGSKTYDVESATNNAGAAINSGGSPEVGGSLKLKSASKSDLLLPLVLMGGSGGGKGLDPLMLVLLLGD
jgi:hypothetical protein